MMHELEGFHVEAALRLTGMRPRKVQGKWVYPHSTDVLVAALSHPSHWHLKLLTEFLTLLRRHDYFSKADITSASEQWIKYSSYSFLLVSSNWASQARN